MNKQKREAIFNRLQAALPEPVTELAYENDFTLLVAIVLSAQATDVSVNKATKPLFATVRTPQQMVQLGEDRLKSYIKSIGLYNAKAKNVIALSHLLIDQHGGQVPHHREALQALPGVGRKTASVWLNCALGHETIAVDTHVQRVSNRIGLTKTTNPLATELALEKCVPPPFRRHAHHWLILHGRYVCKARKPLCYRCPIIDLCEYRHKTPPLTA